MNLFTLIRAIAATVSVAHNTLLISKHYVRVKLLKICVFKNTITKDIKIKPMIVPKMPRNPVIAKFSKKRDFLRLYPAEKMIGGKIKVKNKSPENKIYCLSPLIIVKMYVFSKSSD